MSERLVSSRPPFVPLTIHVGGVTAHIDALLDTGFDQDIVVPDTFVPQSQTPYSTGRYRLADGSPLRRGIYLGTAELANLGNFPVLIVPLRNEFLMGRGLADRFRVTLDHGRQLIIEP